MGDAIAEVHTVTIILVTVYSDVNLKFKANQDLVPLAVK